MPAFSPLQLASGFALAEDASGGRRALLLWLAELRADLVEARLLLVAQRAAEGFERGLHGLDRLVGRLQPLDHRFQPSGRRHRHDVRAGFLEARGRLAGRLAQVFEQVLLVLRRLHRVGDLPQRPGRDALGLVGAEVARRLGDASGRGGAARRGARGHAAIRPGIGPFRGIFHVRRAVGEEHAVEEVVVGIGPVARVISLRPECVIEHVVVGVGVIDRAAPWNVRREQAKLPRGPGDKPRRPARREPLASGRRVGPQAGREAPLRGLPRRDGLGTARPRLLAQGGRGGWLI